jgi:uncharacterized protein YbjT (DUF2867 family)
MPQVTGITSLGRRAVDGTFVVDIKDPSTYRAHLAGHNAAICTLGVGQPSRVSREEFLAIDRDAVLAFGRECRAAGVGHFSLLGSVGAHPKSGAFFLKAKGELEAGLEALGFPRLSLFRPSMILTPQNRYGALQGLTLAVWPRLTPLLVGPLEKYRGIEVARLGRAMALNLLQPGRGTERLEWAQILALSAD